ncbi:hypothetical protein PspLS_08091 [Pyricularia sp. CBS 133598]|nr:hypothetical protein PspLS_08091 [Pyricularia sp. CBS 133598]
MICAAAGDHHHSGHEGLWATEKQGEQQRQQHHYQAAASTGRLLMNVLLRRRATLGSTVDSTATVAAATGTTQAASEPLTSPIELASYPKKKSIAVVTDRRRRLGKRHLGRDKIDAAIWHSNSTTASRRRRAPSTPARSLSTPPVITAPVDRTARSASLDSPERRRIRSASTGGARPSAGRAAASSSFSASKPRPSGHERRVTESEVIWKGVAAAAHASRVKLRRLIITGGVAAIVFAGSIYGAGLKIQGEAKSERKAFVEASLDEQIAVLEERRQYLVNQRAPFERKLVRLHERMAAKKEEEKQQRQQQQQQQQHSGQQMEVKPDTRPAQSTDAFTETSSTAGSKTVGDNQSTKTGSRWWPFS